MIDEAALPLPGPAVEEDVAEQAFDAPAPPRRLGFPAGAVPLASVPLAAGDWHGTATAQPVLPGLGHDRPAERGEPADEPAGPGAPPEPARRQLTRDDLAELLGIPFTEKQLKAICAPPEPAVIVAGAGSGKTSVMAARVVWLVATAAIPPERILGLTFTRKAAGELADRVRTALARLRRAGFAPAPADGPARAPAFDELGEPTVSTYNAFASRLVADHALRLGLEPDCVVLPSAGRYQLAGHVVRGYPGPVEAFAATTAALVEAVVRLDGECGEHLVEPEELVAFDRRWLADVLAAIERAQARPRTAGLVQDLRKLAHTARRRLELAGLVTAYRAERERREQLDFGDQIRLAARLAEQVPAVGELLRQQFAVVLLDEYQDTSVAQRRLLAGLFGGGHPVTAVGDPAQAIYGWRGASASNLDRFPEHFPRADGRPAKGYELTVNQRSGGRLLRLANGFAEKLPARRVAALEPRPEVLDAGETVVALLETWANEADWVASQLAGLVSSGRYRPEQCAVLVRSWSDVPALVEELTGRGLPVEVLGLGGLLVKPEIADIRAMLEVIDDPTANPALVRVLTGPRVRLGPRDLAALGRRAVELLRGQDRPDPAVTRPEDPLAEAISDVDPVDVVSLSDALADPGEEISAEGARRVRELAAELAELREHAGAGLVELIHRVVEITGLDVEIELAAARGGRERDNLARFLRVAADFERDGASYDDASGRASLTSFLGYLRAAERHERGLDADVPGAGRAVSVLTMHAAKGLEWAVVAVPDISRGCFPEGSGRDRWITSPEVLPTPLRGDADDLPRFEVDDDRAVFDQYAADCRAEAEHEERRLAYVAITRAKEVLLASGHWWGPTQKSPRGPSPFLEELHEHAKQPGNGRVDNWVEQSEYEANPVLQTPRAHPWPAPLDAERLAARREAADAVRALIKQGRAGLADSGSERELAGLTGAEKALLRALDQEARLLVDEELAARAPVREVALPVSVTATQLVKLRASPNELARELARPLPRRPAPAARRGTRFHSWVEEVFERRPLLDYEDLPGAADEQFDDAELAELRAAFLAGPYGGRRPLAVEAPFELPIAGRVIRGRIDAVYDLGDGRYEVVDWKTGEASADPVQLAVYRLAWARVRGVPPEQVGAAFLYVRTGQVVRPPLIGEDELAALLNGDSRPTRPGRTGRL
ncbi:MAG: ATP-dependent helicase [Frankia sp.]|nr:ATP-dependent helicase [Frankia sp.]